MMFVEASAIVAILNREPEAGAFAAANEQNAGVLTSALAVFEPNLPVCRIHPCAIEAADADVDECTDVAEFAICR